MIVVQLVLYLKSEEKFRTFPEFRCKIYFSFEFLDDHFADNKSEPYSICINLILSVFDGAKEFKQAGLVTFFYSNTAIFDS